LRYKQYSLEDFFSRSTVTELLLKEAILPNLLPVSYVLLHFFYPESNCSPNSGFFAFSKYPLVEFNS